MSLSKLALFFLAILLAAPWVAARAEPCDELLVRRAIFMTSKRAQLAAAQLLTREMYETYRGGLITRQLPLLGRSLSDFSSYEALDEWRRLETSKDFFEYGPDSARAAIIAGTSEDTFYADWKKCQFDDALKQQTPAFRGWMDQLEDERATVRLVVLANPNLTPPQIVVEPSPLIKVEKQTQTLTQAQGRLIVNQLVTVKRYPRTDIRLVATSGNATVSVVVPSAITGGVTPAPQVQAIDGPRIREAVSFPVPVTKESVCFPARRGEAFDLATIRVTASSLDGGYWKVTKREAELICVEAGETAKPNNPKAPPYAVILRVDKLRPRTATD